MLVTSGTMHWHAKCVRKGQSVQDPVRLSVVLARTALDQKNLAKRVHLTAGSHRRSKRRLMLASVKLDTFGKQQQMAMSLARRVQLGMHVLTK